MKHAPASEPAGTKPDFASAAREHAGSAGGEGPLVFICLRTFQLLPGEAVAGCQDREAPANGIADDDSVLGIPETHAIPKSLRLEIGCEKHPTGPGIFGLVDPRLRAFARTQEVSRSFADGFDVAEVQIGDALGTNRKPGAALGASSQNGPLVAADPYGIPANAHAAQVCRCAASDRRPRLRHGRNREQEKPPPHDPHCSRAADIESGGARLGSRG